MKTLAILQPWASLLVSGQKKYETRDWNTSHRGLLFIHASKEFKESQLDLCCENAYYETALKEIGQSTIDLPLGGIIGIGELELTAKCDQLTNPESKQFANLSDKELAFGGFEHKRWAFKFSKVCQFKVPLPTQGSLMLYETDLIVVLNWLLHHKDYQALKWIKEHKKDGLPIEISEELLNG